VIALLAGLALATTNVGVAEREWRLSAYVPVVPRGSVRFYVHNFGEDPHDLQVRGPQGFVSATLPEVAPGGNGVLRAKLARPGRYTLVCTLPGHEAKGMRATIRVR
jgi:uncharacterized cupredoxin-like copper-binding protein